MVQRTTTPAHSTPESPIALCAREPIGRHTRSPRLAENRQRAGGSSGEAPPAAVGKKHPSHQGLARVRASSVSRCLLSLAKKILSHNCADILHKTTRPQRHTLDQVKFFFWSPRHLPGR